ncbi:hypothetical protein [Hahella chejuensis]|uniref:hypothetical protein n=1 Tax=Hahella chejuensis TaxID=158327 RepID=UPI0011D0D7A1|nr:hypothetical protein [Hahella chejuensis]
MTDKTRKAAQVYLVNALSIFPLLLTGCDGGTPFTELSNYELSMEYRACQKEGLSPGGAQRCNNIERECDIRREEKNFRC